jgi:hypothetical protein
MLSARYDPDAVQPEEINTVIPSALPAPSVVEPPLLTPGRERLLAQAPAAAKSDRMVWSMVLLLGVLLMLSSAGYIVLLLGCYFHWGRSMLRPYGVDLPRFLPSLRPVSSFLAPNAPPRMLR